MALFFTSDTHFGHAKIIKLATRVFTSVAEMDEVMIARWNERVGEADHVYHLGDFCFRNATSADVYRARLNGTIHLVAGNHDEETLKQHAHVFASVSNILELQVNGRRIVLCHYPMREWHGCWKGAWHFFGHVHARLNHLPNGFSLDVGVDSHDFRPWTLDEIEAVMSTRDNPFEEGKRRRPVTLTP